LRSSFRRDALVPAARFGEEPAGNRYKNGSEGGHMNCAHEMCGCTTAEGQEYCSDFCKNPSGDMEGGSDCGCGHSACRSM
jgi:hypothetical protein